VFGVSYSGEKTKKVNYLVPNEGELISCNYPGPLVRATTAKVLGKVAEPVFEPFDADNYASIHSNPPGEVSKHPGLTVNKFGKGKCVYLYSSLLSLQQHCQQLFGQRLFEKYVKSDLIVSSNAPECVEISILKSTTRKTYLVCFVNYQLELPNILVRNLRVTVKLPSGAGVKSCRRVSNGENFSPLIEDDKIIIELDLPETIEMIELQ